AAPLSGRRPCADRATPLAAALAVYGAPAARAARSLPAVGRALRGARRPERAVSGERLTEPLAEDDLRQRLTLFLAAPQPVDRVAERQDRQQIELVRDVQQLLRLVQPAEADPIRANAVGPGGQDH